MFGCFVLLFLGFFGRNRARADKKLTITKQHGPSPLVVLNKNKTSTVRYTPHTHTHTHTRIRAPGELLGAAPRNSEYRPFRDNFGALTLAPTPIRMTTSDTDFCLIVHHLQFTIRARASHFRSESPVYSATPFDVFSCVVLFFSDFWPKQGPC